MTNARGVDPNATADVQATLWSPEIRELEPGDENQWDQFVLSSPFGTFFHLSGWRRVVEDVLGRRCTSLIATRSGKICGVFPIAGVHNPSLTPADTKAMIEYRLEAWA